MTPEQLRHTHRQLAGLQARAAWAYGLAYDRPGQRLRAGGGGGKSTVNPLPVNVTYRKRAGAEPVEEITSASDALVATAYLKAAKELAEADRLIAQAVQHAGGNHHPLRTRHITDGIAPSPTYLAWVCANAAAGLRAAAAAWATPEGGGVGLAHTRTSIALLERAASGINQADRLIPDHRNPDRPPECRNPDNRPQCHGLPLKNVNTRLCESCVNAVKYQTSKAKNTGKGRGRKKKQRRAK